MRTLTFGFQSVYAAMFPRTKNKSLKTLLTPSNIHVKGNFKNCPMQAVHRATMVVERNNKISITERAKYALRKLTLVFIK